MMAAVGTSLFAQFDDPAPVILRFLQGTVVAVAIAGLYLFAVLPAVDGFVPLLVVIGVLYLPLGALLAVPALAPRVAPVAINGFALIALQSSYAADFASFLEGGIALLFGFAVALVVTRLLRSIGVSLRVSRLVQADRRDLIRLAEGRSPADLRPIAAAMLDRFEALAARLGGADAAALGLRELAELRAAFNLLRLRQAMPGLGEAARAPVAAAIAATAGLARGGLPPAAALARIDAALAATCGTAGPGIRPAALALSGLRMALFPEAPPPPLPAPRRAWPRRMIAELDIFGIYRPGPAGLGAAGAAAEQPAAPRPHPGRDLCPGLASAAVRCRPFPSPPRRHRRPYRLDRPMKRQAGRVALTLLAVLLAGLAGWQLWDYYMLAPWTRDGRVRADVVGITPDVSGLVASRGGAGQPGGAPRRRCCSRSTAPASSWRCSRPRPPPSPAGASTSSRSATPSGWAGSTRARSRSRRRSAPPRMRSRPPPPTSNPSPTATWPGSTSSGPGSSPRSTAPSPTSTCARATTSPPAVPSSPCWIPTPSGSRATSRRPSCPASPPAPRPGSG